MVVIGTLNGWLPNCLAAFAIVSISSAEAGVLQATTPIITGILAAALLRGERLSLATGLSLFGGFVGVVLVVVRSDGNTASGSMTGYLLMLGVAASYGTGAVYARWAKPENPALVAAGQLTVAAVVAIVASAAFGESWQVAWSARTVIAIIMLGVFCTALPAILFLVVIARYKAVKVGAASFLQPFWALLLGVLFLSEHVSPAQWIGAVVIILSVMTITVGSDHLFRSRKLRRGN